MKGRMIFLLVGLVISFLGIASRLYSLQVVHHERYSELAEKQHQRVVDLNPPRGTIYGAKGRELAVSVPADSVYAVPREIEDAAATAAALAPVLGLDAEALGKKLQGDGWFAWVARQLDPPVAEQVRALELKGIGLREESRRYYPLRELAAPVLGFVGTDYSGLAGLEQSFDDEISGQSRQRVVFRDAGGGYAVNPDQAFAEAEPGADLHLTLDATVQHIVERELQATIDRFSAAGGSALFLDPKTGAILAMASLPSFDPNRFGRYDADRYRNRVITDVVEPGSAFKLVTAAAALERNLVDPSDVLDCENGRFTKYGVSIRDYKPFGQLTFREVIALSSNIGTLKVGRRIGDPEFYDAIRSFGFGSRYGIELAGESSGIVHPVESWQALSSAYISFGQGIAVTTLQLAMSFAAIANEGMLVQPYLVQGLSGPDGYRDLHPQPRELRRVVSESTARQVGRLLEAVVTEGTAKSASLDGYRLAGKTSTAQVPSKGGYSATDHLAVFAGFVPARNPALIGVVVVDRPRADIHGGAVAAPTFSAIARQALIYLGVPPERDAPSQWASRLTPTAPPLGGGG